MIPWRRPLRRYRGDGTILVRPMPDSESQHLRVLIANEKREFGAVAADRIGLVGVPRRSTWRRDE